MGNLLHSFHRPLRRSLGHLSTPGPACLLQNLCMWTCMQGKKHHNLPLKVKLVINHCNRNSLFNLRIFPGIFPHHSFLGTYRLGPQVHLGCELWFSWSWNWCYLACHPYQNLEINIYQMDKLWIRRYIRLAYFSNKLNPKYARIQYHFT